MGLSRGEDSLFDLSIGCVDESVVVMPRVDCTVYAHVLKLKKMQGPENSLSIFEAHVSRVQSTHWGVWYSGFDVCNRNVVFSFCLFVHMSDMWGFGVVA